MRRKFLILNLFCIGLLFSQKSTKFGKVSIEQLKEFECSIDKNAEASILYNYRWTNILYNSSIMNFEYEETIHKRIKIYNKEKANEFLTYEIPVQLGKKNESISNLKVIVYNLENGNIVETNLEDKDIFIENINKYFNLHKFTFPNIKDGSIIDIKYKFYSPYYYNISTFYFQESIPTIYNEFVFSSPDIMKYYLDSRGEIFPIKEENSVNNNKYDFLDKTIKLTLENVPSKKPEEYVNNPRNILATSRFELIGYEIPGRLYENFATTWDKISKNLIEDENFGKQYLKNEYLKETINSIVKQDNTPKDKVNLIYDYVQKNIHWNKLRGIYTDVGVKKCLETKSGNVSDINLLLVGMLKAGGINAAPMVFSTIDNGILSYSFPSRAKLNYVIATYTDENGTHFLDASDKTSKINLLNQNCLVDRGYIINDDKTFIEKKIKNIISSRKHNVIDAKFLDNKIIKGSYKSIVNNFLMMKEFKEYNNNKENYKNKIIKEFDCSISDIKFTHNTNFITDFNFEQDNQIEKIGNKIIFNPLLFDFENKQIFNQENRVYNIELGSPIVQSTKIKIEVPSEYKIENLPESSIIKLPESLGEYKYVISENNNTIEIFTSLTLNESDFSPEMYQNLKLFWRSMVDLNSKMISLSKK